MLDTLYQTKDFDTAESLEISRPILSLRYYRYPINLAADVRSRKRDVTSFVELYCTMSRTLTFVFKFLHDLIFITDLHCLLQKIKLYI